MVNIQKKISQILQKCQMTSIKVTFKNIPSFSRNSHLNFENLSESLANKLAILILSPCWLRCSWSFIKASSCAKVPRPSIVIQILKNSSKNVGTNSCASKSATEVTTTESRHQKWEGKAGRKNSSALLDQRLLCSLLISVLI